MLLVLLASSSLSPSSIHDAVRAKDLAKVRELLAQDPASVNARDGQGRTPLFLAAQSGQQALVDELLAKGARLDAECADGRTMLHAAAAGSLLGLAERLVKMGRRVDTPDHYGRTPLCDAVQEDATLDTVTWLLARGANPNPRDWWGVMPVYYAAQAGRLDVLEALHKAGARLDARMWNGDTPLLGAFGANPPASLFWLIEHGARLDAMDDAGETVISRNAAVGRRDVLEKLLAEASRRNLTRTGYALHRAAVHRQTAIAEFLLATGVEPDVRDARGQTPLHYAALGGAVDAARLLLGKGADVNARDAAGVSPLHVASSRGRLEIVTLLLERKADVHALDREGRTPFTLAAAHGYTEIAGALSAAGGLPPAPPPPSIPTLLATPLQPGEAQVWYLHHCAFAVRTKNHLLIFDYARPGPLPRGASLANGFIVADQITGLDVTVFVSHNHEDHFDPRIFEWEKTVGSIRYVLGWQEREGPRITTVAGPRASVRLGDMDIRVVNANHNLTPEVAYLVNVDGLAIFHSGDYGGLPRNVAADMGYLKTRAGKRIDLAFLWMYGPIAPLLKPAIAFPMHMGGVDYSHWGAARALERIASGTRAVAFDNKGDRFDYRSRR
jgi:ankyrin repeat protein/L-ascorbate metabolism protein UlaG (beta-lactamase superfamily)